MKTLLASLALTALLAACGQDHEENPDGPGDLFSCDNHAADSTCAEYGVGTTRAEGEASCDGTFKKGMCPLPLVVARCRVETADGSLTNVYYSDGPSPRTEADVRETCTAAGGNVTVPVP